MPRVPVSQPVPATSPARPIARLSLELRVTGRGQFALGLACLVVALTASDLAAAGARGARSWSPSSRSGGFSLYGSRWLRRRPARPRARRRPGRGARLTARRSLVKVAVGLVLVAFAAPLGPAFGVVFGGLLAGVGAVELRDYTWVRERENAGGRRDPPRARAAPPSPAGARALHAAHQRRARWRRSPWCRRRARDGAATTGPGSRRRSWCGCRRMPAEPPEVRDAALDVVREAVRGRGGGRRRPSRASGPVAGMSCITPMAPTLERALWVQPLSCQAMARAREAFTP